jgi:hypothetical protein
MTPKCGNRDSPAEYGAWWHHRIAVHARYGEWRLALRVVAPFVVHRRRDQASAFGERLPEHAGCGDGLRPGVERAGGSAVVSANVIPLDVAQPARPE